MSNTHKLGLTACAIFAATAAAASAADLGHGTNGIFAVVTQSSCGTLSASLKKGTTSLSTIEYPGPGKKATLVSPGTTATSKPGSATTSVCVANTATPSTGLSGKTVAFSCYGDTAAGPAKSKQATIKATFKVGNSHARGVEQLTVKSSLYIGSAATPTCAFTTDGTAILQ